jgi:hypothetical protein
VKFATASARYEYRRLTLIGLTLTTWQPHSSVARRLTWKSGFQHVFTRTFSQVLSLSMRVFKSGHVSPLAMLSFHLVYPVREPYQRFGLQTVRIRLQNNTLIPFRTRTLSAEGTAVKYCEPDHTMKYSRCSGRRKLKVSENTGQLPSNWGLKIHRGRE